MINKKKKYIMQIIEKLITYVCKTGKTIVVYWKMKQHILQIFLNKGVFIGWGNLLLYSE